MSEDNRDVGQAGQNLNVNISGVLVDKGGGVDLSVPGC